MLAKVPLAIISEMVAALLVGDAGVGGGRVQDDGGVGLVRVARR